MKDFIIFCIAHYQEILASGAIAISAFITFLGALYTLALLVPGDHPDKEIKWLLDFTQKYSRKPSDPNQPPQNKG